MKFNRIHVDKEISKQKGLGIIDLQKLSHRVALVGKNGSGKTRILDLLEENLFERIKINDIVEKRVINIPTSLNTLIFSNQEELSVFLLMEELTELELSNGDDDERNILFNKLYAYKIFKENRVNIDRKFNKINSELSSLKNKYLKRIRNEDIRILKILFDQNSEEDDFFESIVENSNDKSIDFNEIKVVKNSAFKYLSKLPNKLAVDQVQCLVNGTNFKDRASYKRYIELKNLIKKFLQKDLDWKNNIKEAEVDGVSGNLMVKGFLMLDERAFDYNELSDGEKILFTYALLFFLLNQSSSIKLKDSVLLIDEPELHLHPDTEIELIDAITSVIKDSGQFFFATHSINILSTLNYDEVFTVKDGTLSHPSQHSAENSLYELMSIPERINKLNDFMVSQSSWSYINFLNQCFFYPESLDYSNPNDPQFIQFKDFIFKYINDHKKFKVLDFGAGTGRVFEHIKFDSQLSNILDYYAYEPFDASYKKIKMLLPHNSYSSINQIKDKLFDVILFCNVLHEIKVSDLISTLNSSLDLLDSNGYLFIMESNTLKLGEKIDEAGYLFFNEDQLKILFNINNQYSDLLYFRMDKSCNYVVIPKAIMKPVTPRSLKSAVENIIETSFNKIIELRLNSDNYSSSKFGTLTAFYSVLHINAKIGLKILSDNSMSYY